MLRPRYAHSCWKDAGPAGHSFSGGSADVLANACSTMRKNSSLISKRETMDDLLMDLVRIICGVT